VLPLARAGAARIVIANRTAAKAAGAGGRAGAAPDHAPLPTGGPAGCRRWMQLQGWPSMW
jgi:hypothetical protein